MKNTRIALVALAFTLGSLTSAVGCGRKDSAATSPSTSASVLTSEAPKPKPSAATSASSAPSSKDPEALVAEGFRLYDQKPSDKKAAKPLFEQACNAGDNNGCAGLGLVYVWGDEKDYAKGYKLLDAACTAGQLRACAAVGKMCFNGWGTDKDLKRAETLFKKACDGNESRGCELLGLLYLASDPPAALALLDKACKAGREEACQSAAKHGKTKELRSKVSRARVGKGRNAICAGKDLPPYRWDYSGGTYAENQEIAEDDGCVKLHKMEDSQWYCCPTEN